MRIKSISIKNYRQYQKLNFSFNTTPGLPNDMNIIIAQNGTGKSNFLNAITWCLYNKESHLQEGDRNKGLPIVNIDTIDKTGEREDIEVKVKLVVEFEGSEHTIERRELYVKNSNIETKIKKIESTFVVVRPNGDVLGKQFVPMEGDAANAFVNRIFPEAISQYFFFDNEQMNNYFRVHSGSAIMKSINDISKVTQMNMVIGRIENLEREFKVDLSSGNAELVKLNNDVETARMALENRKKEKEEIEEDLNKARIRVDKLSEDIKGAENLKNLEFQKELADRNVTTYKQQLNEKKAELDRFVVRYSTLINLYPAFKRTIELINQKDHDRQLPPDISMEMLKRSAENCKCELCENILDDGKVKLIYDKLRRFNVSNPVFERLLSIRNQTNDLIKETEQYEQKRDILFQSLTDIEQKLDEAESTSKKIVEEMKTISNQDEVREKIDERESLSKAISKNERDCGVLSIQIKTCENNLEKAIQDYEKCLRSQKINEEKRKKYSITKQLKDYLVDARNQVINDIRTRIASKTYENFSKIIWKQNTYSSVEIDANYNIDLKHKAGYSAIGSTSAAERALLALSFTNAMHEVSGFDSPLVIDSPVGRVSDVNREKFALSVAEISKRKQIIMLFTPDEYSNDISKVFDSIAVISHATMNDKENIATIK